MRELIKKEFPSCFIEYITCNESFYTMSHFSKNKDTFFTAFCSSKAVFTGIWVYGFVFLDANYSD